MSVVPLILSDVLDELYNPSPLYDQHFGLGLLGNELRQPRLLSGPLHCGYLRPWSLTTPGNSGVSTIEQNSSNFKVSLDVQQFKPEEIAVKLSGNNLVIEAKHEERKDKHGFISRQFTRRYKLPENLQLEQLKSTLSSDGVLTLTAPKKVDAESGDRSIPIVQTNQPALKQNTSQEKKEEKREKMES